MTPSLEDAVYLDHHATTPVDERVAEEMTPYLTENFGNPASDDHLYGAKAKEGVEQAREQISEVRQLPQRRDHLHQWRNRVR